MTEPVAELKMIAVDCVDASTSARFWSAVLGWDVAHDEDGYAMLTGPTTALGFDSVDGFEAPAWPNPNGTKQFHFDLAVDDIAAAEARCVELGATVADPQTGEGRWRVLLDPSGHPFCLTLAANWG